jgi:hypothetical protein
LDESPRRTDSRPGLSETEFCLEIGLEVRCLQRAREFGYL